MAANASQGSPFDGPSSSRPSPRWAFSGAETLEFRGKPNARKSIGRTHSIASAVMLCMVILRYPYPGTRAFQHLYRCSSVLYSYRLCIFLSVRARVAHCAGPG